jgi:hypothetical protein
LHCREGLPLLPFFNITVPLHDNHASIPLFSGKLDCMHYCHPGAPQVSWNRSSSSSSEREREMVPAAAG